MEVFIEEMVERKRTAGQLVSVLLLMVLSVFVCFALMVFVVPFIPPMFSSVSFLLVVGVFYVAYRVAVSINVEYEYSLVNTEIDVDRITNKRRRKRITTARIKGAEAFGVAKENKHEYEKYLSDASVKKVIACHDKKSDENYYVVYLEGNERKMLVFSPSERIIEIIRKANPRRF